MTRARRRHDALCPMVAARHRAAATPLRQGAYLHGAPPERHWVWEQRRAWLWGLWLPLACLAASLRLGPWGLLAWLIYPLQVLRQTARNRGPLDRAGDRSRCFRCSHAFPKPTARSSSCATGCSAGRRASSNTSDGRHAHRLSDQPIPQGQPQLHPPRDPGARAPGLRGHAHCAPRLGRRARRCRGRGRARAHALCAARRRTWPCRSPRCACC